MGSIGMAVDGHARAHSRLDAAQIDFGDIGAHPFRVGDGQRINRALR